MFEHYLFSRFFYFSVVGYRQKYYFWANGLLFICCPRLVYSRQFIIQNRLRKEIEILNRCDKHGCLLHLLFTKMSVVWPAAAWSPVTMLLLVNERNFQCNNCRKRKLLCLLL